MKKEKFLGIVVTILLIGVVIQAVHTLEHVAQVIQKYALGLPAAHGLLGEFLDREPVHFTYNLIYLVLLAVVFVKVHPMRKKVSSLIYPLLLFALVVQSWHFVEHSVKMSQHLAGFCIDCPGVLGTRENLILLHFTYNFLVLVPATVALIKLKDFLAKRR